jgi:hypothetical protein
MSSTAIADEWWARDFAGSLFTSDYELANEQELKGALDRAVNLMVDAAPAQRRYVGGPIKTWRRNS